MAQVISIKVHKREVATEYEVECSFRDKSGSPHQAHIRVRAEGDHFSPAISPETARIIRDGERGEISIRYSARMPSAVFVPVTLPGGMATVASRHQTRFPAYTAPPFTVITLREQWTPLNRGVMRFTHVKIPMPNQC